MEPGVLREILSQGFADERFCALDQTTAATKPVPAGYPDGLTTRLRRRRRAARPRPPTRRACPPRTSRPPTGGATSSAYTLTIEQTGGSAHDRAGPRLPAQQRAHRLRPAPASADDPNAPGPGKRPRSSMSPTIVTDGHHGRPVLALGSPGGSTIITTVLQVLLDRLDFGMSLPQAVAAPRASQRNTAAVQAEPALRPGRPGGVRAHVRRPARAGGDRRRDRHRAPPPWPAGRGRGADAPRRR